MIRFVNLLRGFLSNDNKMQWALDLVCLIKLYGFFSDISMRVKDQFRWTMSSWVGRYADADRHLAVHQKQLILIRLYRITQPLQRWRCSRLEDNPPGMIITETISRFVNVSSRQCP